MAKVRTRFAPSPTGYVHVGNIRTALWAYLIARHANGDFMVRIEDTDRKRFVDGAENFILNTLRWMELRWDEGVRAFDDIENTGDEVGRFAPYRQSERQESYLKWAKKLIDKGLAYGDPYTEEEVEEFRKQAAEQKKPFLYRNHRPEILPKWDGTTALRLKVPEVKRYTWHDEVMGELSAGPEALDDIILIKADGLPTYNFAHIVDDAEMEITHVVRGTEFIPSIPKYLSIYEALGIERPAFVTVPEVMGMTGGKKMGKRDGAKSVDEYRLAGYLPEALNNYLAMLGWNDGTEDEIFSLKELVEKFEISRIQRAKMRFDEKKLEWLNGQWIRKILLDDLFTRCQDFWGENGKNASNNEKKKVLAVVQDRLKTLADLPALTEYFFMRPTSDWAMVDENKQLKKLSRDEQIALLRTTAEKLESTEWDQEKIQMSLNELLGLTESKPPILFGIIRFALTWATFSPGLPETMMVLGKTETIERINAAIDGVI